MANSNSNTSDELLRCPITFVQFHDPVLAQDGHTYERQAIEQWIRDHGTSPLTRQPLSIEHLYPNRTVKELVDRFETLLDNNNYQFTLDADVKRKRPLFHTTGKTIYHAEWLLDNSDHRPEIVLLKIDGARASKEASFYVNLSRHPHIIRTFGFVHDTNNPNQNNSVLLLQEYAPEGSLYELLDNRPTAPAEQILIQLFLQIIEAMIYLAHNKVVHGDLACRNVLVFHFEESQPERNVIKITDFGLSRHSQLYSRTAGASVTRLNIVPVRYAAPEVLLSNAASAVYTEKSDVYSMGVLMWEAYSRGSIPWANIEGDDDVIRRVTNGDLLPQPSNCSQRFWSIITKTWSSSPTDRPNFSELKYLLIKEYYYPGSREQAATAAKPPEKADSKTETEEFAAPGKYKELDCKGRLCAKCGKCRDWYYTGDLESWEWVQAWKNWDDSDWKCWYDGDFDKRFKKRTDNPACIRGDNISSLIRLGTRFFGLFSNYARDSFLSYAAPCLCADNIVIELRTIEK